MLCGSRTQSQREKQQQTVRSGFNTCARGVVSEPDTGSGSGSNDVLGVSGCRATQGIEWVWFTLPT